MSRPLAQDGVSATERGTQVIAPVIVGLLLLATWWLLVEGVQITPTSVPGPEEVVGAGLANWGIILEDMLVTGANALIGLIGGALLGVLLAGLASRFAAADGMLAPIVVVLAVVPIVALAPIFNAMFGAGTQTARQLIALIASFVPIFVNTLRGLRQTRPVHRDLFRASAATGRQTFLRLTLPTALPFVLTGLRIASSLAVISALVAEYFGGPLEGIGASIGSYAKSGNHPLAWAYVGGGIFIGLVFFLVTLLLDWIVNRHRPAP